MDTTGSLSTACLLDGHAQIRRQIFKNAFGNALGNAATAAIRSYQLPDVKVPELPINIAPPTGSVVVGDIPQSIGSVGLAQKGTYGAALSASAQLTHYNPFNGPLLASADDYSTYTGVYGLPGGAAQGSSDYLMLSSGGFEKNKDLNQLYTLVAEERVRGAPAIGTTNPSMTDLMGYVKDYEAVGVAHPDVPTLAGVTVTASADESAGMSGLAYINSRISGFNNAVKDRFVDQGSRDLREGDYAGFIGNGLLYAGYSALIPNSVEEGVIGFAGGTVIGKGLGLVAKGATAAFPLLGRDLGDLSGGTVSKVKGWLADAKPVGDVVPNSTTASELSPFTQRYLSETGGRWGTTATREQNFAISQELEARGYTFGQRPGGGLGSEEYIPGPGPGTKGSAYVDITAIAPNGRTVRIQTVTTMADGVTPTPSEMAAAARIRAAFPNDKLLLVPKR